MIEVLAEVAAAVCVYDRCIRPTSCPLAQGSVELLLEVVALVDLGRSRSPNPCQRASPRQIPATGRDLPVSATEVHP